MANLTEEMYELLDDELKAFSCLTPKKKACVILQDFKNSKLNEDKASKTKNEVEAELYDYQRMRLYTKAQREICALSDEEMYVYLDLIQREIVKDLNASRSFGKMLDKIGIYNSAIFLLTEHVDGDNVIEPKIMLTGANSKALIQVEQSLNHFKRKICDIDKVM